MKLQSYSFNGTNVIDKGSPVSVGYGRLIVGSQTLRFRKNKAKPDKKLSHQPPA